MLGGVCGGIAEYFVIDSTIIRLVFVLFFAVGASFLAYLVGWIIIPEKPTDLEQEKENKNEVRKKTKDNGELDNLRGIDSNSREEQTAVNVH
ncbi:MAG: PspC domain-containing protein [Halanaerobiales bacterium]